MPLQQARSEKQIFLCRLLATNKLSEELFSDATPAAAAHCALSLKNFVKSNYIFLK